MKKIFFSIASLLVILAGYFLFWPVPIEPVAWNAPAAAGYTGPHAFNTGLSRLNLIDLGAEEGPEHIVLGKDGKLYVSVGSGNVLRMNPDGSGQEVFIRTGGRVLGFDFDKAGNLIAADAIRGLLSVSPQGKITLLTRSVNGDPIRYADAVVVARSGMIYLSDASRRFSPAEWGGPFEASILDIMEMSSTGRVLAYDPAQKSTRVVASGFCFANGLALSRDEQNLFVNETGKYRLWKVSVHALELDIARPGDQAKIVFDNLPGFPDNLMRGQDGKIWMGFAKPRNPDLDQMGSKPFLRKITLRLPRSLWPVPKAYGHVFAFTEDGRVVADLQDPGGAYPETTGVTETADRLYIQSLHAKGLGWLPK